MKLWKRRTTIALSILLFIILAPTIILYSSGYRFDFDNFRVKKVGMIIIDSTPEDIDIYINNKLAHEKAPFKRSNLTPRDYRIDLKKENYQSWQKTLTVESQTVTWITNVLLLYSSPLKDVYAQESNIKESHISPNQSFYSYIHTTEDNNYILKLLNLKSRENINISDLAVFATDTFDDYNPDSITNLIWSNDSRKIFLSLKEEKELKHVVIDVDNPNKVVLIEKNNLTRISWDINDSNFIYFINNSNLEKLNIRNQDINTVIAENIDNYDLVSNSVMYNRNVKNKDEVISSIYLINKNNSEADLSGNLESINIINENISTIKAQKEDLYLILTKNKNLYLKDDENMFKIGTKIIDFEWSDKKQFLYYNNDSIWHYKIEDDKNIYHPQYQLNEPVKIVERADDINLAQWHPENEHILYSSNNTINIIELDSRDTANDNELVNDIIVDPLNPIYINNKGDKLFHLESIEDNVLLTESTIY